MQSKGVIKLLAILLAIACIYQLSFSLKARSVEKKAAEYAAKVSESDSLRQAAEIYYLDSVQNWMPVFHRNVIICFAKTPTGSIPSTVRKRTEL